MKFEKSQTRVTTLPPPTLPKSRIGFGSGTRKERQTMIQVKPRLLPIEEAARYLGISAKTIRNRLGPRAPFPFPVKPKRIGKRVLFDVRDLDRYVDTLPAA